MNHHLKCLTAALTFTAVALIPGAFAQSLVKPDAILASNSRLNVTMEDLTAELARIPEENRLEFLLSPQRLATVVENILIAKVMSAEAQQTGLQNRPVVAAEIRNQSDKVLSKYRREEIEANAPKIDLTPLAREIFYTRVQGLERPALYTSWHALIKFKDRTREAALEQAKMVKAKVDAGEPLEVIAKAYSNDESVSVNSGFIRPAPLSVLEREFANTLAALKIGESAIAETEYGYHIIRLLKLQPAHRPTFEEAKTEMLAEADRTYKKRVVENYIKQIRVDPTLKFHSDVLDQVRPRLPEIPPPPTAPSPTRSF